MRGFGALSSDMEAVFTQQMASYRDILISLYRKKSKEVALRESYRFQYLTGAKSQILSAFSGIYNRIFADRDLNGEGLTRYVLDFMQRNIPMVELNGGTLAGWMYNPMMVGGRLNVGFLSPTTHILSEPFNNPGDADQRAAYKIYFDNFLNSSAAAITDEYFLSREKMKVYGVGDYAEQWLYFSMPPAVDWVAGFLNSYHSAEPELVNGYGYMTQVLSTTQLKEILEAAKDLLTAIIEQTKLVISIQGDVDQAEGDLAAFVEEFRTRYGLTKTLEEILAEIRAEADRANQLPLPESSLAHSVTSTSVCVPGADPATCAAPSSPKKSNVFWWAAAAVAGYYATRK